MKIITTSQKANQMIREDAQSLAASIQAMYIERGKSSISSLFSTYDCEFIGILSKNGLSIYFSPDSYYSFHLSMAQLRLIRIRRGEGDHLVNAIYTLLHLYQSKSGKEINHNPKGPLDDVNRRNLNKKYFSYLDCTLGLGSDSIVVSYAFPHASVKGLEGSLPIWLSTSYGLSHYIHSIQDVTDALRRIDTQYGLFEDYLLSLADNSIDILYFDPMFEVPIEESPQFKPLRGHTVESRINDVIFREALRIAKHGIIIKERPFSSIFKNFPPTQWIGGKYSRVGYGVYLKEIEWTR